MNHIVDKTMLVTSVTVLPACVIDQHAQLAGASLCATGSTDTISQNKRRSTSAMSAA